MHLAFFFFPFIGISNINIWCGQQNHERSTMETESSITNLDIADGIVACKFNKPCEAVLVVEEAEVLGENHRPWTSNW
jgi:hypothetical protein